MSFIPVLNCKDVRMKGRREPSKEEENKKKNSFMLVLLPSMVIYTCLTGTSRTNWSQ